MRQQYVRALIYVIWAKDSSSSSHNNFGTIYRNGDFFGLVIAAWGLREVVFRGHSETLLQIGKLVLVA